MSRRKLQNHQSCPTVGSLRLRRLTQAYLTPYKERASQYRHTSKLDEVYSIAQHLIMKHQCVTTGLFPRYSKDTTVGYVKDSIYCAIACWACSLAYKRMDDERGRQTELRQSAVKTMRGILFSWMQQTENLSRFSKTNSAEYALHARFDLQTGMSLQTPEPYGHLQMDLVALYLLSLVQMISGGTRVIYTHHEANFIQNLVFYIERTYRTPDFGMWERGTRYNNGKMELHASSLGMVKAALEAINGFNVFGSSGGSSSVIYVDIDGHNRNRTTFETILPRESNSKNTDASLLMTVGWPGFATHDETLFQKTIKKCVRRLEGRYGIRRDGYRTELEDNTRQFYEEHETSRFDGIECQFPMFFTYICLTAHLRGEQSLADDYWNKLQSLLVPDEDVPGGQIMPECYCVDEMYINKERNNPNSTEFYPLCHNDFGHHLWSNAVYLILLLIREGLIHTADLDPINRRLPASQRPKLFNRHSAFQGSMEGDPVVQIALIAESTRLQMMLSTYGISSQTPHEVEPIQIWPSWRMVKVFENLGRDEKLGLNGRPLRPFGPLSTSKVFRVFGDTVLCYPLLFEVKDFYTSSDPPVLIDDIKRDIEFVSRRWKLAGRPTMCLVLREENLAGEYFDHVLNLLVQLKNGYVNGIRVRMGRVHQLLNTSCIEHVDFCDSDDVKFDVEILEETDGNQNILSRLSLKETADDNDTKMEEITSKNNHELYEICTKDEVDRPRQLAFALVTLWERCSPDMMVHGQTVRDRLEKLYRRACQLRLWWIVRFCAGVLQKTINSLSPAITNMLVRGKKVTVGMRGTSEECISRPLAPSDLSKMVFDCCPSKEPQAAVMQQELIIACSDLMTHSPSVFDGVLTIRLSWLMDAINLLLEYLKEGKPRRQSGADKIVAEAKKTSIYELSPTAIKEAISVLLTSKDWNLLSPLQTRRLNGALNRMPIHFYNRVWSILERAHAGIVIAGQFLPQQPTLSDMTEFELTFSYRIEEILSRIATPEYRQLTIELLCIIATIVERNAEIAFGTMKIDCDSLIRKAFDIYADQEGIVDRTDLTPFYKLENLAMKTSTATYLTKVMVDFILNGRHFSQVIDIFGVPKKETKENTNCKLQ